MTQNLKKQVDSQVDDIMAELSSCSDRDPGHFSIFELKKAVRLLKTKKACGNDNVYNEHLIHGVRKSKKDPNNYRAITLSSAILKLFERILLKLLECNLTKPFSTLRGGSDRKLVVI